MNKKRPPMRVLTPQQERREKQAADRKNLVDYYADCLESSPREIADLLVRLEERLRALEREQ